MFQHLDSVITALLAPALPAGAEISMGTPSRAWAERARTAPTVNVFLHQVRHDPAVQLGGWVQRRDGTGRVVAREQAPREYHSCYLVTAWDSDIGREHSLLGAVLAAVSGHDVLPASLVPGPLAATGLPVRVSVGSPTLPCAPPDLWSGLGIPPRSALDLVLTAAVVPAVDTDLTRPPRQLDLDVATAVGAPADAVAPDRPDARIREHAADRRSR